MKNLMAVFMAVFCLANQSQAGIWSTLSDANKARLESGGELTLEPAHTRLDPNEIAQPGEEPDAREPLLREVSVFKLIDATPAEISGIFSSYDLYVPMFGSIGMTGARSLSDNFPTVDSELTKRSGLAGITTESIYGLRNRWSSYSSGGAEANDSIRMEWKYVRGLSPNDDDDVYHIEGYFLMEPVTTSTGRTMTVVRYMNYINPKAYRAVFKLNLGLARDTNKREVVAMVNRLKSYLENGGNSSTVNSRKSDFCGKSHYSPAAGCGN